jgi:hypothetical protein
MQLEMKATLTGVTVDMKEVLATYSFSKRTNGQKESHVEVKILASSCDGRE